MTCPLCDYEGSRKQVEAHISAMGDDAHKGKTGREVLNNQQNGQQQPQKPQQQGQHRVRPPSRDSQQQTARPGKETRGTALDVPRVACKNCGRKVAYPELMPYKMTCPGCDRTMKKRDAAETMEKKADEKGKDETVETVEV